MCASALSVRACVCVRYSVKHWKSRFGSFFFRSHFLVLCLRVRGNPIISSDLFYVSLPPPVFVSLSLSLLHLHIFLCIACASRCPFSRRNTHLKLFSRQGPKNNKNDNIQQHIYPYQKPKKRNSWNIFLEQFCSLFPPPSQMASDHFASCGHSFFKLLLLFLRVVWKSGIGLTTLTIIKQNKTNEI